MIYLDNAATSFPKPEAVYRAVEQTMREGGNAGRGSHGAAVRGAMELDQIRQDLSRYLGIGDPTRLIFTVSATDALNMAIKGVVQQGDHVITSVLEHNSVLRPLAGLEQRGHISVTRLEPKANGLLDPAQVVAAMRPETKLLAITMASNVLGTLQPVRPMIAAAHARGVKVLLDGAQAIGDITINAEKLGADMLAIAGHKALLGPAGTGLLYVAPGLDLLPWREGGTGRRSECLTQPDDMPDRLEAGTYNLPGLRGLQAGVAWLGTRSREEAATPRMLIDKVIEALLTMPRVRLYGIAPDTARVPLLTFNIAGVAPSEVGSILDHSFGIAVRTGLHCAPLAHRWLGTAPEGAVRISPGPFTSAEEIDAFIAAIHEITAAF
jgi:cysteine desulfurase/selenocysteine lyase